MKPLSIETQRELVEALSWAMPLARIAYEDHRLMRLRFGHSDMTAVSGSGQTWVGITQAELDKIEGAQAALAKARAEMGGDDG